MYELSFINFGEFQRITQPVQNQCQCNLLKIIKENNPIYRKYVIFSNQIKSYDCKLWDNVLLVKPFQLIEKTLKCTEILQKVLPGKNCSEINQPDWIISNREFFKTSIFKVYHWVTHTDFWLDKPTRAKSLWSGQTISGYRQSEIKFAFENEFECK